jgi:hypothetical protein
MAEITNLEEKLGEVLGLAQAAQQATKKVARLAKKDEDAKAVLDRMGKEAAETEKRCKALVEKRAGKKSAINKKARETKSEASEMMSTYLDGESDALDGFEFLTMAEAGELGHWRIVRTMAEKAKERQVVRLAEWAIPIQERHFDDVNTSSLRLAAEEDPNETS